MPVLYRATNKRRVFKMFLLVLVCTATAFVQYLVEKLGHSRPSSLKRCLRLLSNDHKTRLQHKSILFLKTHKTGSSTLTNILNRYAENRQLDVVVPVSNKAYTFYWPLKFRFNFAHARSNNLSKVLCNHARFNKIPMNILMPKRITKYITILREPVTHYESIFYSFHLGYALRPRNDSSPTIDRFLTRNISLVRLGKWAKFSGLARLAKNPQLFDLGLDLEYYENKTAIEKYIEFLDSEFDFVLILEHFDESLVLMKRLFCWDLKDILYVKQMGRLKVDKGKETITDDLKRKIRRWNKADVMLYSHFNATLWKRIYLEGPGFKEDLRTFREELKRLQDVCLEKGAKKTHAYAGRYVSGYKVKANLTGTMRNYCQKFVLNEIDYLDYHRRVEKLAAQYPGKPLRFSRE